MSDVLNSVKKKTVSLFHYSAFMINIWEWLNKMKSEDNSEVKWIKHKSIEIIYIFCCMI